MLPTLNPGQSVLVWNWFLKIKEGDMVVFQKEGKLIIKRVKSIGNGKLKVAGDNTGDSKDFGLLKRSEIIGKAILAFNIRQKHQF